MAPEAERRTDFPGTPASPAAMARFGSSWRQIRARRPRGADVPSGSGASGEALPVPSDAGDGEAHCDAGGDRPLEGASGTDDGLPSFSPIDEVPASPAGLGEAVLGAAAVYDTPGEEAPAPGRDLPLFSPADEGHGEGGQVDGTRSPKAGACGFPPCTWAAGPGAQPHGVVSPPACTVFGGGIGVAPTADGGSNANVAHSVEVSESDSDLGASTPATTAANEAAATVGPEGGPSLPGTEDARR